MKTQNYDKETQHVQKLNMIFSLLTLGKNPPNPKLPFCYNEKALLFIGPKRLLKNKNKNQIKWRYDPLFPPSIKTWPNLLSVTKTLTTCSKLKRASPHPNKKWKSLRISGANSHLTHRKTDPMHTTVNKPHRGILLAARRKSLGCWMPHVVLVMSTYVNRLLAT